MKLSIALATYNGARYLGEQLASFEAQGRKPDELIVCDEQSTDATQQILHDFARSASFPVRVVVNERRLGIIANFEKAITLCTGDVIFLSDQDDVWRPEKLARHEAIYETEPDVGLVFSDAEVVDSQLRPVGLRMSQHLGITPARFEQLSGDRAFHLLVRRSFLQGCTLSFRATLRPFLEPFPTNHLHDQWIPAALSAVTRFRGIADPLIDYRRHEAQTVGVSTLAGHPAPEAAAQAKLAEVDHQIDRIDTLGRQVARFRDRVRIPDADRVLGAKRAFLERRRRAATAAAPARVAATALDLLRGSYFRYASYPKGDFLGDLKGT